MPQKPRTFLSRLTVLCTMLCMVTVVMAGFASAQARLQVLEHQIAGDELLSDGGWAATCQDDEAQCKGHLQDNEPSSDDLLAVHHHHHNSVEVSHGLAADLTSLGTSLYLTQLNLRPGHDMPLAARNPALPYHPPRA
jgi:hypothetical protein